MAAERTAGGRGTRTNAAIGARSDMPGCRRPAGASALNAVALAAVIRRAALATREEWRLAPTNRDGQARERVNSGPAQLRMTCGFARWPPEGSMLFGC